MIEPYHQEPSGVIYNADCLDVMRQMPDKSVDLVLTDPPYFEVKGDFDFQFENFESFLVLFETWAREWKRILKDNGSLYCFGHAKKIAYKQVILDKYFKLENNLVWEKNECQSRRGYETFRQFMPVTERILFYSNEVIKSGLDEINDNLELFKPIRNYFLEQKEKCKYTLKEINEKCFKSSSNGGGMASNILTSYKNGWSFPTQDKYEALQKIGLCKKPYEELRKEYEELRRPWNNEKRLTDVLKYSQDSIESRKWKHETIKPIKLIQDLILCSSREGDTVLDCFLGSGTTARACKDLGRKFIGIEIEEKYCEIAVKRLEQEVLF